MKYFISMHDIDLSDNYAAGFCAEEKKEGYVRLYNKNSFKTTYYKIVGRSKTHFGYIVSVKKKDIDPYWDSAFIPINKNIN